MPHGFTWGLVLLKDLSKPPILFGIFMPKSKYKNREYLRQCGKTWNLVMGSAFMDLMPCGFTWLLMPC